MTKMSPAGQVCRRATLRQRSRQNSHGRAASHSCRIWGCSNPTRRPWAICQGSVDGVRTHRRAARGAGAVGPKLEHGAQLTFDIDESADRSPARVMSMCESVSQETKGVKLAAWQGGNIHPHSRRDDRAELTEAPRFGRARWRLVWVKCSFGALVSTERREALQGFGRRRRVTKPPGELRSLPCFELKTTTEDLTYEWGTCDVASQQVSAVVQGVLEK